MKKLLFVQGILNWATRPKNLLDELQTLGYEVIYFPLYYQTEDLHLQKQLIQNIDKYLRDLPQGEEVILLGHSFGGVIAHSLSTESCKRVEKLLTVASPHNVPLNWFKKIQANLNYQKTPAVEAQYSFGCYLDMVVPFIFTKSKNSKHKNFLALHNTLLKDKNFIKKILKITKEL
jgi:pimeloyl-ACP methyl ester carboxylesterase